MRNRLWIVAAFDVPRAGRVAAYKVLPLLYPETAVRLFARSGL